MITSLDMRSLPPAPPGGSVVSIGVFDGVHLGHQAILRENLARARALDAQATVVTFRRHPKRLLLGREPRTLTSLEHRLELFRRAGVDHTVVLSFDESLRDMSAERFAFEVCLAALGARAFVLGFDSKFGRDREGSPELLAALGLDVQVVPPLQVASRPVSSTAIREAVELGDLEAAAAMLGRPVSVLGTVVHGREVGAELGFPTANLNLHHELHPPVGVYACRVRLVARREGEDPDAVATGLSADAPAGAPAVANVGLRPTIDPHASEPVVEVHLLDFRGDLYGATLELEFLARLRPERRFEGLTALREQIGRDVEQARRTLGMAPGVPAVRDGRR